MRRLFRRSGIECGKSEATMSLEKSSVVPVEKLYERTGSMYKLVIIAAKRALELSEGSPKLVEGIGGKEKPAVTALREIAAGRVGYRLKKQGKEEKE